MTVRALDVLPMVETLAFVRRTLGTGPREVLEIGCGEGAPYLYRYLAPVLASTRRGSDTLRGFLEMETEPSREES